MASKLKIHPVTVFFLIYFCIYATSPFLVYLHTEVHNELHASVVQITRSPLDMKLFIAELLLSIVTGEERNDTGPDPSQGTVLKVKAAEVQETVHSRLKPPARSSLLIADELVLARTPALTGVIEEKKPLFQKGFCPLHSGLSPPST
ncbi:MAG TPA: hypothetical protein VEI96_04170 [Thermodesulfovibrionales bacterium]|nr:hypothetical protein [Thermodesulfovibrionales bacterium]